MRNNLERRWTKMVEMAKEAKETLAQITTMVVAERINKSGRMHPRSRVTIDHQVTQSDNQVRYYTQYR